MLRIIWFGAFLFTLLFIARAQNRYGSFMFYQNIQALNGKRIYEVCEGSRQNLWMATSDGLVRFDGYRYTVFYAGPGSITDNQVSTVLEDDSARIWIGGNLHGISRYDSKTGRFRRWPVIFDSSISYERVRNITKTTDGSIWIATDLGLGKYNPSTDSFFLYQPNGLPVKFIDLSPHPLNKNLMWVLSGDSLYIFDIYKKKFFRNQPLNAPQTNGKTAFTCMESDGKDGVWIGTWAQGIYHFDGKTSNLKPIIIPQKVIPENTPPIVNDIKKISDTAVMFACSGSGLIKYNPSVNTLELLLSPKSENATDLDIISISEGPHAGIWVGAIGTLIQWHPYFNRLGTTLEVSFRPKEKNLIVSELAFDSLDKKHLLACAGKAGMVVANETFSQAFSIGGKNLTDSAFEDVARLPGGPWLALAYYSGRTYAISTDKTSMQPFRLNVENGELPELLENDIYGRLWAASNRTLYCFKKDDSVAVKFNLYNKVRPISRLRIYSLKTDRKGRAWLSTNQGLYRADAGKGKLDHLSPLTAAGKQMNAELVKSLAVDHKNGIWVGYDGAGIQRIDADSLTITDTWLAPQLPSTSINHLCITYGPQLLAATPAGLAALKKINDDWELYTQKDGLINDFLDRPVLASPLGYVLVNQPDKIQFFHEDKLKQAKQPLKILLSECQVNNELFPFSTLPDSILHLSYHQNNIDLRFAAMHWLYPRETKYFYRIYHAEENPSWNALAEPRLQLAALKPGNYRIQLIARGAGGSKSDIFTLQIHLHQPWWGQWWFILLAISATALLIYFVHRYRISQILAIQQIRNRISKDLHDDIGSTLTSIHILSNVSEKVIEQNPAQAKEMLQTISTQSKQVQQNMSDIVWAIRPDNDKVENLVSRMREYIGQTFEPQQIHAVLEVEESILQLSLPMEYRKEVLLVYKEAMNNVLRHSGATAVEVHVSKKDNLFQLEIMDNGRWKENPHSSGTGSHSMRERALHIGGTLEITDMQTGTRVTLTAPIP